MKDTVLIIGAGLSGLLLASKLKEKKISYKILEGKQHAGGRILTIEENYSSPPMEMGAMWFLKGIHTKTENLLEDLNIDIYPQYLEGNTIVESATHFPYRSFKLAQDNAQSYRIKDGNITLIKKLLHIVDEQNIHYGVNIKKIEYEKDVYNVFSDDGKIFESKIVVTTIPPNLLVQSVEFSPSLPTELLEKALNSMTWKGQATKFAVSYKNAFWREQGFSGLAYSNKGPLIEFYDHSNYENNKFSLMGFVSGLDHLSTEERQNTILKHLETFFGSDVNSFIAFYEKLWIDDEFVTFNKKRLSLPEKHNIGIPIYTQQLYNGNLYISGSETSQSEWAGYLEGAVDSADRVYHEIIKNNPFHI